MKKTLRIIGGTLLWLLYCLITQDQRQRYLVGKYKNAHCYKQSHGLFSSTAYIDKSKKPEREYITWKEFRKVHKF